MKGNLGKSEKSFEFWSLIGKFRKTWGNLFSGAKCTKLQRPTILKGQNATLTKFPFFMEISEFSLIFLEYFSKIYQIHPIFIEIFQISRDFKVFPKKTSKLILKILDENFKILELKKKKNIKFPQKKFPKISFRLSFNFFSSIL